MLRKSLVAALICSISTAAHGAAEESQRLEIPAGELVSALETLSRQAAVDLVFQPEQLRNFRTDGVSGTYSPEDAIRILLKGTPLQLRTDASSGAMVIASPSMTKTSLVARGRSVRLAHANAVSAGGKNASHESTQGETLKEIDIRGIPEMLVEGSRVLNTDVVRTRDDIQPYVIFDAETIANSGATSLDDFFKQRLPMNTTAGTARQSGAGTGNRTSINLRGLGDNQTLILVDGKRQSGLSFGGTVNQPDINNIPLAAIDRIEILPTTASGIYGGSAIGGVVNIILRRDFSATEVRAKYGNSFDGGGASRQFDVLVGTPLRAGKTSLMFSGSWKEEDPLLSGERDFYRRGLSTVLRNNPDYLNSWIPLGSTPNIRSVDGSPLFGPGTPSFTSVPKGYAGGGGLAPLQQHAGQYNFDSPDSAQKTGRRSALLEGSELRSANLTVRNEFTSRISGFLDLSASSSRSSMPISPLYPTEFKLLASAPNNPFGQDVYVDAPVNFDASHDVDLEQRQASTGLIARLPADWTGQIDWSLHRAYAETRASTVAPVFIFMPEAGAIDFLKDSWAFIDASPYKADVLDKVRTTTRNAALRLSGPVGQLPGGRPVVNMLIENRLTRIGDGGMQSMNSGPGTPWVSNTWAAGKQDIDSVYLELTLPIISHLNRRTGINELELQVAGRYDRYENLSGPELVYSGVIGRPQVQRTHDSVDPTFGVKWAPIQDLVVRGSYGTGFLPPDVNQMTPASPRWHGSIVGEIVDPARGNSVYSNYEAQFFGNPNLEPEQSKSWSAGVILTPRVLPELRVSLDYTRIEKTDAIIAPRVNVSVAQLIENEAAFPDRVVRGPSDSLYPVGPIVFLDLTNMNAANVNVTAYDLQLDYALRTERFGDFDLFALVTRQTEYNLQLLPSLPFSNRVGLGRFAPLEWRGNVGVNWNRGDWSAGWLTRFYGSYYVEDPALAASAVAFANQGSAKISSQVYHDLFVSFDLPVMISWISGAKVQLGVNNVLNKTPPVDFGDVNLGNSSWYSQYGDPRLASYYLSMRMSF